MVVNPPEDDSKEGRRKRKLQKWLKWTSIGFAISSVVVSIISLLVIHHFVAGHGPHGGGRHHHGGPGMGEDMAGRHSHKHVRWFLKHVLPHRIVVSFALALVGSLLLFVISKWGYKSALHPCPALVKWRFRRVVGITIVLILIVKFRGYHDIKTVNQFQRALWRDRHDSRHAANSTSQFEEDFKMRHHHQEGKGPSPNDRHRNLFSLEEKWNSVMSDLESIQNFWSVQPNTEQNDDSEKTVVEETSETLNHPQVANFRQEVEDQEESEDFNGPNDDDLEESPEESPMEEDDEQEEQRPLHFRERFDESGDQGRPHHGPRHHHGRHHAFKWLRCLKKYIVVHTVVSIVAFAAYLVLWKKFKKSLRSRKGCKAALKQTIADLQARVLKLEQHITGYPQAPMVHSINSVN